MLITGTVLIFTSDKDTGADIYLNSSLNGRGKTAAAKLAASWFYTFLITLLFFAADLMTYTVMLRIDGFEQPLYSLSDYFSTPYTMALWQFILLYFLFRLLGFLCISSLTALVTVIMKKPIPAVIGSFACFIAMLLLKTYCLSQNNRWINLFNPLVPITAPKYIKSYNMIYLNDSENRIIPFPINHYAVGKDAVAAVSSEDGCLYLITEEGTEKLFDNEIRGILYTSKAVTVFDVYSENAGMVVTFALMDGSLKDYGECAYYADEDRVYFHEDGKVTVQEY